MEKKSIKEFGLYIKEMYGPVYVLDNREEFIGMSQSHCLATEESVRVNLFDKRSEIYREVFDYEPLYEKDSEYGNDLEWLNGKLTYTLCGYYKYCNKYLTNFINVDRRSKVKPDTTTNIFDIIKDAHYNLDFEGWLSRRKINHINKIPKGNKILLTYKKASNSNTYLKELQGKIVRKVEYNSNGVSMVRIRILN